MPDITKGKTFSSGDTVTAADLNSMLDDAVINDSSITANKLADQAVTSSKITAGTIVNSAISASAAISLSKLEAASDANPKILIVGSDSKPAYQDLSGDATIDASGVLTLGSGVVEAGMLATDSVGASAISENAVGASELADDAVDTAAIVDGAVTSAKLASGVGGKVLQVVFASTDATTFTHNQDTFTDITGVSASITPSSTSSRILIEVSITHSGSTNLTSAFGIDRDRTAIGNSDEGTGNRINAIATDYTDGDTHTQTTSYRYMDTAHNSTSALTYKATVAARTNYTFQLNKAYNDENHQHNMLGISSITLTEISA